MFLQFNDALVALLFFCIVYSHTLNEFAVIMIYLCSVAVV